jgi:hypothetical protein
MEDAPLQRAAGGRGLIALAALAAWAMAVPWFARAVGAELDVPARLEMTDHVVPGAVVLVCCAVLAAPAGELVRLGMLGVAALAGFWITATHAVLLPEAIDGISPWPAALLHLSAGAPVTVLALWLLLRL